LTRQSDEARQVAVKKAKAAEEITTMVAKQIVATTKKKGKMRGKPLPPDKLSVRLVKMLERYRARWKPDDLAELVRQLRQFADASEKPGRSGRKKAKE
jgi:hypothetical protein